MSYLARSADTILEILAISVFVILVIFNPLYRFYRQYKNWKEVSAEYGFHCDFRYLLAPSMQGELRGHSIQFQNAVYRVGRSLWSSLQIWIPLTGAIPLQVIIYQRGNKYYRPSALDHLEKQNLPPDFPGERLALEGNSSMQVAALLQNQTLQNLFTSHKCICLAIDGEKIYYERNDISCSAEELKQLMEYVLSLAEFVDRQV